MQGWRRAEPLARGEPRCAAALYRAHNTAGSVAVWLVSASQNDFDRTQIIHGIRSNRAVPT
jgi:hypothetical protein